MQKYLRLVPLLAVLAFGAVWASWPHPATATPLGPPTWSGPNSSGIFQVIASYTDDSPVGITQHVLSASGGGIFVAPASVSPNAGEIVTISGTTVTVTDDADTIPQTKTITANFQCTSVTQVTFTLTSNTSSSSSIVLTCSYVNNYPTYPTYPGYPTYPVYPTNPGYPSYGVMSLGVSASPASLSCGSASTIAVSVRDGNGNPAPDGTAVSLSASMGTVSPTTGTTYGGSISGVFTLPSSNGPAVITASSGSASGQATVSVSCASTASVPPSTSAPPPVYAPPPVFGTAIYPPNTGDAGLASTSGSSTRLPAALAVALTVLAGGALVGARFYRRERAS